ncbi:MAG: GGDEF domain-containing response regulator [Proteobacteria bacterium]|nr:GGDEF domain-containing response regulator [Pseudomonadota bacterium]MBU1581607.1 GGDEF domain-containing response regulator [Pseudomonadota bacterium]MBU2456019.1 GGDEF domain-containing response regulator [Pseudomonadota bacterium]MBU2629838.1 GGDEF domain-containing response regulator [Pseudomonadota bacterium]
MNIICDKILVIAKTESKETISNSLKDNSGLEILEADSENKAFELIYNHFFVLVIVDETLVHIDMYKIGAMLLSHKNTHNTPLLIITGTINPQKFLTDFKALHIDYIVKPFDEQLIQAKINIFFDLFKQKKAVDQSIDELDKVYKKIVAQHERFMNEDVSTNKMINHSTIAGNQMQQPLRTLQGNVNQLLRNKDVTPAVKSNLGAIKTAAERISQINKKLLAFPGKSKMIFPQKAAAQMADQTYRILYVENSDEDFSIFNHLMKSVITCTLIQAKTLEQSLERIAGNRFDLIFIAHLLPDGTGFDLLSRLNRMRSDIPVIFTMDKAHLHKGPEAVSKGAFTYFIKEEISSANILSIIYSTLEKAKITQDVEDAQNRIVMISKKDPLTKLYNRQCFDQELESETSKAKRYNTALSILIVDFDHFNTLTQTHGHETGDAILTTSAALIQSMVRNNDVVCRYGGEEFGIVLPNTALNGARMLAERMRKKIANHEFKKDSTLLKLTVSIGIAPYIPDTDTSCSLLVKRALDALTSAMEQGGNTVKTLIL